MERTVCQQLPHNILLEIIHVDYTGDVPTALTVNGIFSRDVHVDLHTGIRKAHWNKKSCGSHELHNSFHQQNLRLRAFPLAVLKFSKFGLGKKQNCSKYFGNERTAPISNPSLGRETEV